MGFLSPLRGGLNEVVEFGLEGVEHAKGVLEPFGLLPEFVGFFRIRLPYGLEIPRLDLAFDLQDKVFVEMRIQAGHKASFRLVSASWPQEIQNSLPWSSWVNHVGARQMWQ